jgi:predicted MPP superfamily phosphohydrolase
MGYRFTPSRSAGLWIALIIFLAGLALLALMYRCATSDPVIRTSSIAVTNLKSPVRLVLMSDIHVAGPDMPPSRLRRIVQQINALHPDAVLIAGDFVSDKRVASHRYSEQDAITPLAGLKARLGAVAVLGNHDHWRDATEVRSQLRRIGVRVLDNEAIRLGPLTIGGVDDPFTGNDEIGRTVLRMRAEPQPRILLSHSPDVFPRVPADVALTLAGHTHCGQIRLPFVGALSTMSNYGERYACGRIAENGRTLIVSAGLGTSLLPLRLGAVPDIWLVQLRPVSERSS